MAVPTITNISPATGPAGGRTVVKITGTNFAVPPTPAANTHWAQTVQVLFDGVASQQVLPYGADLVACVSPPFLGAFPAGSGSIGVDVIVNNLDPVTGEVVSGETVTESDGWTYTRQGIAIEAAIKWVTENVAFHLIRQTIDNVVLLAAHPDYDSDQTTPEIEIQQVPALVLTPRIEREQFLPTELVESEVASAAEVTDTTTYPVTAGTGELWIKVDREEQSQRIVFVGTETSAAHIAATIAAQITGATVAVVSGQVEIVSSVEGALSFLQVTKNPAAHPLLTFPTAEQEGDGEEQTRQVGGTWANIAFDVRGIEHTVEKLDNLADMLVDFVKRSGTIPVPETIGNPNSDVLWLPVAMVDEPFFPDVPENNAIIKEFLATFIVRGIVLGDAGIASLTEDFHSYVGVRTIELDLTRLADT